MLDPFLRQMLYPVPPVPVPSPPPPPLREVVLHLAPRESLARDEVRDEVGGTPTAGEVGGTSTAWLGEAGAGPAAPLVLFFHGNGENLETLRWAGTFEAFERLGVAVLAVEYPGYGGSPGTPSEAALAATADAALAWAEEQQPGRRTFAVGWSLGAAVAVALAARSGEALTGVVALSAWARLEDVARRHFPLPFVGKLLPDRYDSLTAAARLRPPALVIHGARDEIIPVEEGRRLAAAFPEPVRWVEVPGAGHNDLLGRSAVWEEMGAFFRRLNQAAD